PGPSANIQTAGGAINIAAASGQALTFLNSSGSGTATFNLNGGPVNIATPGPGSSVTVGNSVTLSSVNTMTVVAPRISLFDSASIVSAINKGTAITLEGNPLVASPFTLNLQGTVNLTAGDGTGKSRILLLRGALGGSGLTFTLQSVDQYGVASSATATLQSNAPLAMISNNGVFVDNNVAITTSSPRADPASQLNLGNTITIRGGSTTQGDGSLTLEGTPGAITVTGGGNPIILIEASGPGASVNLTSSYTFGAGSTGEVDVRRLSGVLTPDATGSINLAANTTLTITGGSTLRLI